MKKLIPTILLLSLLLGACSNDGPPNDTSTPATPAESIVTEHTEAGRQAVLSDVENTVSASASSNDQLVPASSGMVILPSGRVETGDDGRAKIELRPDGTIVRIGPNSSFTIPTLTLENGEPKTKLHLLFGKVFILLNGGSLEVETPSGVASVRGSLLSVQYDPEKGRIEATCLEGHCALEDEDGDKVELTGGESSFFIEGEDGPSEPELIDQEDIQDWLDENPELSDFLEELPDPEDFPEDFDTEVEGNDTEGGGIPEDGYIEGEGGGEGEGEPEGWHSTFSYR